MPTTAPYCCSVTRPGGDRAWGTAPSVCPSHALQGWALYARGDRLDADRATTHRCGCVYTSIEQIRISLCPTHRVGPMACCPEATRVACVCAYSYACPTHGDVCYGTHD